MKNILILLFLFFTFVGVQAQSINYTYDNLNRLTQVDYGNGTVIEYCYDELGNQSCHIISGVIHQADLTPNNVSSSLNSIGVGGSFTLNFTNHNAGTGNASAHYVRVYLSANNSYQANDDYMNGIFYTSLAAGNSDTQSLELTIPEGTATGQWYLIVFTDATEIVSETDETNNQVVIPITVTNNCTNPLADFNYNANELQVTYTNTSLNGDSYTWTFGDPSNSSSTDLNSMFTYAQAGTYTVCLTATNTCGSHTECKNITVSTCVLPTANFAYSISGLSVTLTNTSQDANNSSWDFGDSSTSTQTSPTYTYSAAGTYNLCLTATNSCGSDLECVSVVLEDSNNCNPCPVCGAADNELLAYYPFNGNANDESGNNHHGIVNGATLVTDRFGNPNSAYSFNGNSNEIRINNPFGNSIDVNAPIVVAAWIKTNSDKDAGGVISYHSACSGGNQDDFFSIVHYGAAEDKLKASILDMNVIESSANAVNDNNWHHVVLKYTGSTHIMELYIDGIKVDESTGSPNIAFNSSMDLVIGGYHSNGCTINHNFEGSIDDVRLFNKSLTSAEITELYNEVDVIDAPVANFNIDISFLTATFINTSENADTYNWDFGDNTISTQTSPNHTYDTGGIYNVCLTTSNSCGSDVKCMNIEVIENSTDYLLVDDASEYLPHNATFTYNIVTSGSTYELNFGDGNTETLSNINGTTSHSYQRVGAYYAILKVDGTEVAKTTVVVRSCGWIGYVNSTGGYIEDNEALCDFINSDRAYMPSSLTPQNYYWTNFQNFNDFNFDGDDLTIEARIKNPSSEGGISCYDTNMSIVGEKAGARVVFMQNLGSCSQYSSIGAGQTYLSGSSSNMTGDLQAWRTIKLVLKGGKVAGYYDGALKKEMDYMGSVGKLKGVKFNFKGSGSIDWIKIYNGDNDLVYQEDFSDCNSCCEDGVFVEYLGTGSLPEYTKVSDYAKVGENVIVKNGERAEVKAINFVSLEPGFESKAGSVLDIDIESACIAAEKMSYLQERTPKNPIIQNLVVAPSPFQQQTSILYELKEDSPVELNVYDLQGSLVKNLVMSKRQNAGAYKVTFHASHLPTGLYHFTLQVSENERKVFRVMKQ